MGTRYSYFTSNNSREFGLSSEWILRDCNDPHHSPYSDGGSGCLLVDANGELFFPSFSQQATIVVGFAFS